jgi:hypothetical protein
MLTNGNSRFDANKRRSFEHRVSAYQVGVTGDVAFGEDS